MSDHSNESNSGLRILGGTLATIVIVTMCVILGVFGIKLLGAQFDFPPPETPGEQEALAATQPQPAAPAPGENGNAAPQVSIDPALMAEGKTTYGTLCIACHGPDAKGMPNNMAPPLAGSDIVNGSTERLAMILLNGIHPEGRYTGVMVSWKPLLDDYKMAAVITFIRNSFGNSSGGISPEQMAWARDKYKADNAPYQHSVLDKVTTDLPDLSAEAPAEESPPAPAPEADPAPAN